MKMRPLAILFFFISTVVKSQPCSAQDAEAAWQEVSRIVEEVKPLHELSAASEREWVKLLKTENLALLIHNSLRYNYVSKGNSNRFEGPQNLQNVHRYYLHQCDRIISEEESKLSVIQEIYDLIQLEDNASRNAAFQKWFLSNGQVSRQLQAQNEPIQRALANRFSYQADLQFMHFRGQQLRNNIIGTMESISNQNSNDPMIGQLSVLQSLESTAAQARRRIAEAREKKKYIALPDQILAKNTDQLIAFLDSLVTEKIPKQQAVFEEKFIAWQNMFSDLDASYLLDKRLPFLLLDALFLESQPPAGNEVVSIRQRSLKERFHRISTAAGDYQVRFQDYFQNWKEVAFRDYIYQDQVLMTRLENGGDFEISTPNIRFSVDLRENDSNRQFRDQLYNDPRAGHRESRLIRESVSKRMNWEKLVAATTALPKPPRNRNALRDFLIERK